MNPSNCEHLQNLLLLVKSKMPEMCSIFPTFPPSFFSSFPTSIFPSLSSTLPSLLVDQFSSAPSLSRVQLFATPWIAARQASLSITNSQSSLRLTSIESVMPSSHLILCRPLLLLPPIPLSISLFQWVNSSHEVAKVLKFHLQHHSFQRNPRADSLQNGLVGCPCSPRDSEESSPQHHSSKASILWRSAFFTVQLSHLYMTTGKTIAVTRWTFVVKVMSLLFNMLSRLVITFLPRSKRLLGWLDANMSFLFQV